MNGATDTSSPVLKRSTSPRPPAVGEEVKQFHDTSHQCPEQYKNWNMDCNSKTVFTEPIDQAVASCTDNDETGDCVKNSPNPSPPAAYKWAKSLQYLLDDGEGIQLFQKFLEQEGQKLSLIVYLAIKGLKKNNHGHEDLFRTIKAIFKKLVKVSAVSDETKNNIKQKVETNTNVDSTIFDKAFQEIEAYMIKTTYPNFLKSDLFIHCVGGWQNEFSPEKERVDEPIEQLPTVHEDSELYIPSKVNSKKLNLLQRNKSSYSSKFRTEAPPGLMQSPYSYSSFHTRYNAYLPVSTQDSELQSLSSDAQTDDTMSLTDGSSVDYPTHSRVKHKRPQKILKHPNNPIFNPKDSLTAIIPRSQCPQSIPKQLTQEEFHAALVKALNKLIIERRNDEKLSKSVEGPDPSRPEETSSYPVPSESSAHQCHRVNTNVMFEPGLLNLQSEENDQAILDQHISRVFNSGQHTPAPGVLSPTFPRPPGDSEKSRGTMQVSSCNESSEYPYKHGAKYRKDHDTYSNDSAMYQSDDNMIDYSKRYNKEQHSKHYSSKKFSSVNNASSSSLFDSGISCESVPTIYSNSSRKTGYNSSRTGSQDTAYLHWSGAPGQQYPYDASAQRFSTTDNLVEARRRLEDRRLTEDDKSRLKLKKPSKKCPIVTTDAGSMSNNSASNEQTVIGYSFGRHAVPYLSKLPGKNITLRQFKSILSKRGNFRYFFKTPSNEFGTQVVFEEVTEDSKILPLWEGKVFCVIESMDDNVM